MSESPTRRSSIPILKQTNKTKSFQSFVNLKIIDNADQSGRIHSPASMSSLSPPILEFPKVPPKPPVRTVVAAPSLHIDNDIVITKLCDENKRIKEYQTQLLSKYEEGLIGNQHFRWYCVLTLCKIFQHYGKIWKFKTKTRNYRRKSLVQDEKFQKKIICKRQWKSKLNSIFD